MIGAQNVAPSSARSSPGREAAKRTLDGALGPEGSCEHNEISEADFTASVEVEAGFVNSHLFGSARSSPGREAAKRTLDGEDRLIFLCTPVITTNCRCYGMMEFGWDLNGTRPRT